MKNKNIKPNENNNNIIDFNEKIKSIKKTKRDQKRKESIDRLIEQAEKLDWKNW